MKKMNHTAEQSAWTSLGQLTTTDHADIAAQATTLAQAALPGQDVEILWDGMWVRRVGSFYTPEPDLFRREPQWHRWSHTAEKYLADATDYWFHVYKPTLGDVIVDIGAGRGEDCLAFSQVVGGTGRVWAIEPHPISFGALERFCRLNRLANVTPVQIACTDSPGDLQIETLPVWESNYIRPGEASPTSHPVSGERFDALIRQLHITRIDFLKMNIEGAELSALPGCMVALQRARFVCIAAHDFRANRGEGETFRTLAFVKRFLLEAGFRLLTRDEDPRYYVPYHVHGYRE